nr:site-specific integrase [Candidatus Freyarchaeota archaeon]
MNVSDLEWLEIVERSDSTALCRISRGQTGVAFKNPVLVTLPVEMDRISSAIYTFVYEGLSRKQPKLVKFVFENQSLMNVAKYLYQQLSRSKETLQTYVQGIYHFCNYAGKTPDQLVAECFDSEGFPNQKNLYQHGKKIDDFLTELQIDGLASSSVNSHLKSAKILFKVNKVPLSYPFKISVKTENQDRAPTPEEVQKLVDIADLRERVIVSCLALGGFREGTLAQLKLYHVWEDLEKGIIPLHIHIEPRATKGAYCDYDTFLGREAVEAIKDYLKFREQGSPCGKIPPEELSLEAPLIRNEKSQTVKPITAQELYKLIHSLYFNAGFLKPKIGRQYDLKLHGLRKFFRTMLGALGVPSDYIEYMMGHKRSAYNDIKMKGVEFLRNIYAASGFSIRPKTLFSKVDMLKEFARLIGLNPEVILTQQALVQPHRTTIISEDLQLQELRKALKEALKHELTD